MIMILADKIIYHRKKLNLTQEELASELDVSRQSVSKWEGAQSIPDMNKIILLSNLFNVSIDYLMRDEYGEPEYLSENDISEIKKVDLEFANQFVKDTIQQSKAVAFGVMMIIVSPVMLVFFVLLKEEQLTTINEETLIALGTILLFVMIASAVGLLIKNGFKMSQYDFLNQDYFETEYGVEGAIKSKEAQFKPRMIRDVSLGVMMIILSVIPIFISELLISIPILRAISTPLLLIFVGVGVYLLVRANTQNSAYKKLLQVEDYTPKNKKRAPLLEKVGGIYWLSITAIYLAINFMKNAWHKSWIIWPVAGVLFGVISIIVSIFVKDES